VDNLSSQPCGVVPRMIEAAPWLRNCRSTSGERMEYNSFANLLAARHSCRAFRPERVPMQTIQQILRSAQRAPSDCNIQPWKVIVLGGAALDRLRDALYVKASSGAASVADIPPIASYSGEHRERRRACGWALYGALGIQRGDRVASGQQALENFRFFGAPHVAIITTDASLGARGMLDCGGYVTTFMLAATELGLGTVAQASIAYRADVIREHLSLPAQQHVVCGIAFGWPNEVHSANSFRTARAALEEVADFRFE
jgi:nitroreductase